jgi:hypothetical protein
MPTTTITYAEPLSDAECAALLEASDILADLAQCAQDAASRRSRCEARALMGYAALAERCVDDGTGRLQQLQEVIR